MLLEWRIGGAIELTTTHAQASRHASESEREETNERQRERSSGKVFVPPHVDDHS